MARRRVVAGNWKMNHGPDEARAFVQELPLGSEEAGGSGGPDLVLFPPALSLAAVQEALRERKAELPPMTLGVQNVYWEAQGAFTGEVSAHMAREAGAGEVLVGHSERRHVFGESDAEVEAKVRAVRAAGLVPVACVGETLEEREDDRVEDVLLAQLDGVLQGLGEDSEETERERPRNVGAVGPDSFRIAYEPVWAIGTGRTATPEDAGQAHAIIRRRVREVLGPTVADGFSILYGGSVKPGNAEDLLAVDDVDGLLVGGASLDASSFAEIARAA